jgi:hypothetical protein
MRDGAGGGSEGVVRMNRSEKIRGRLAAVLLAGVLTVAAFASCTRQSPPQKPVIHATKAFDAIFGDLPSLPLPGPAYATIAYFPSSLEPDRFRPVPIFSVEPGKEEALSVRTVIRGIEAGEGPADELQKEIVHPFPSGSELVSLSYDGGLATVTVGGNFRAEGLSAAQKEKAAKALALTVSQFGKTEKVEVADREGAGRFGADAKKAEVVDIGPPKILGLMAIREGEGQLPGVLSVLFDRPVFVEDAAFFPPGDTAPVSGKVYSTAFGMTLEFHPEPKISFDPGKEYRVRLSVRDGKGRQTSEERNWRPKVLTRH